MRIFDDAGCQHLHFHFIVIKFYNIPPEKAVTYNAIYFYTVNTREYIIIIHMKIQIIYNQPRQIHGVSIGKINCTDSRNTADNAVAVL